METIRPIRSFWPGIALLSAMLATLLAPTTVLADPADIDAAARGVVRVLIVGADGDELYPVSHGTGFAVGPETIVTNAHVIEDMRRDPSLSIGLVPPEGGNSVYGRLIAVSDRNDLALVRTTAPMNLPPLTIAGNPDSESGSVTSVGYPMNVDRAQGLGTDDIFRAQPPVKSTGFLSGRRPSRDFDTILHTAPIARGNSGGPLVDNCGRVVGVNSFGADSEGADAEFFFAVSTRELLPFLRENGITPQINGLPCRSLAEFDEAEQQRAERAMLAAQQEEILRNDESRKRETEARRNAEFAVIAERENGMMLAVVLLAVGLASGFFAWNGKAGGDERQALVGGGITVLALAGSLFAWFARPGFNEIDERIGLAIEIEDETGQAGRIGVIQSATGGDLVCVIQVERSRITTGEATDVPINWSEDGCVNGRTQYGQLDGEWQRVLVPDTESVVSVASYDPADREYRVDRYLLGRDSMAGLREARGSFAAPACGTEGAATELGRKQAELLAMLPASPNERLVYKCGPATEGS